MRRLFTVLLVACAAIGVWIGPAQAHNVLVGSDPKDGATLTAAPRQITLVFDQAVRQGYAQVGVTGPDGAGWADGAATVAKERVTVKVRPLTANGAYVIGYRILSSDGHPVTGRLTFTLNAATPSTENAATGVPSTAPSADAPSADAPSAGAPDAGASPRDLSAEAAEAAANGGAGMAVVWIAGALVLLAAGTVLALRRANPAPAAHPTTDGRSAAGAPAGGDEA